MQIRNGIQKFQTIPSTSRLKIKPDGIATTGPCNINQGMCPHQNVLRSYDLVKMCCKDSRYFPILQKVERILTEI